MAHSTNVLTFLGALQDVRELLSGLARYCTLDGLEALITAAGFCSPALPPARNDEVTSNMFLIATLCCPQDISKPAFQHLDYVTEVGQLAVQRVAAAVLNGTNMDERQITFALATSTVPNVLAARRLCLAALQASVCPANCFRLLRFAEQCGITPLRQVAEQVCLASMPRGDAPAQDAAGFELLHPDQLQSLLQSDGLQVSSELGVFHAIAAWVQARPQERAPLMGALVRSCVRLGAMDLRQLEELDQDPAVLISQEVTRVVAQAYIMRILGGPPAAARTRDCITRAAAETAAAETAAAQAAATAGVAAAAAVDPFSRPAESMVWAH